MNQMNNGSDFKAALDFIKTISPRSYIDFKGVVSMIDSITEVCTKKAEEGTVDNYWNLRVEYLVRLYTTINYHIYEMDKEWDTEDMKKAKRIIDDAFETTDYFIKKSKKERIFNLKR